MHMRAAWRLTTAMGLILAAMMGGAATTGAQTNATALPSAIPAAKLSDALDAFERQTGLQIVYVSTVADGVKSNGAPAGLSPEETLKRLLSGTGLSYRFINSATVTISADVSPEQHSEQMESPPNDPVKGVEEIVVTAQKQGPERLRDVPIPISVVNAQKLAETSQLGIREFYSTIPSLNISDDVEGRQYAVIRGITTGRAATPTVGTVIDDVPFGFSLGGFGSQPDLDPSDLKSVEVLRGPQGTLYGANSMGGLIRYNTLDPSFAGYSARASAGVEYINGAADPSYNLRGSFNAPLTNALALRVSGYRREEAGYIDDPSQGKHDVNPVRGAGGLIKLLWQPLDALSVKIGALYQRAHGDGFSEVDRLPGLSDLQQSRLPGAQDYINTVQVYTATITATLGDAILTSITGYSKNDHTDHWDGTYVYGATTQTFFGAANRNTRFYDNIKTDKIDEELRVNFPITSSLQAFVGGFFARDRYIDNQLVGSYDIATGTKLAGALIADDFLETYVETAGFANLTYLVTDQFDIQFGGRYSHSRGANPRRGFFAGALFNPAVVQKPTFFRENVFTYLVSPRFKLSPEIMIYARVSTGYRPGGANTQLPGVPSQFNSDNITNYEIGMKGDLVDHKIFIDTSIYYIDWSGLQLNVNKPVGGFVTNGSGAKSEGVELSVTSKPLPGLTIEASTDYDNAVLSKPFPDGSPLVGRLGDRLPFSSGYTASLSVQQDFALTDEVTSFVSASFSYVGDRISNFRAPGILRQVFPAYTKTDLRVGLNFGDWSSTLYVNNLTDERGVININNYIPFLYTFIQPRTVGLSVSRSF